MPRTPGGGKQHGLGHVTYAIDGEEPTIATLLEAVLRHPEELYLAMTVGMAAGGVAHRLAVTREGGAAVKNHQLPWTVGEGGLLTIEE